METAVFDEDFIGVHAGHYHARKVNTCAIALQCVRDWCAAAASPVRDDARRIQKFHIRLIAVSANTKSFFKRNFAVRRIH